ncbi:MAG TPA: TIM barrel protein [Solirubrobacteraceae bacterium]|jgi:sugar phosphate isomerase/epimerase|nr:TIM barrel protein [Solirubrobacteraceae bacterium]
MSRRLSRREFIGAGVGVTVAASLGGASALGKGNGGRPTIPPGLLGVQQFSVRDATARLSIASSNRLGLSPAMGFLGGPDYPQDPTDLGPLVPLPGGFAEVFEFLASAGVRGFEFFQSSQNVNELGRQPTADEIRGYLDAAGLKAVGTHQFGLGNFDPATGNLTAAGEANFEFMSTLGMDSMGFSGNLSQLPNNSPDPANPGTNLPAASGWVEDYVNPVTGARTFGFKSRSEHANRIGEILQSRGVKYFYHPEQDNYRFFNDPAHPEFDTVHRIEYVMDNTDPALFGWEIDVLHNWSGRVRFLNATTHEPDISVWDLAQAENRRVMGWHIKDGFRNTAQRGTWVGGPPESGGAPYTQTFARTPTFTDTIVSGEGDLGAGPGPNHPNADPDCPGFKYMFENVGGHQRLYLIESDSGPGPATGPAADPGRSLRHAKASAAALLALRR